MVSSSVIRANLESVRRRIAAAAERSGRAPESVRLVAVTKTVGLDEIRALHDLGVRDFGESRVLEALRRIETLKEGTEAVGNRTRVKVVKNKMAPPFKQAEFDILYGVGISREGGLIDMGVEHGFVRKSGAWYTYEGDQLGQGKENARGFLRDNPDLANEIEKKILEKLGVGAKVDLPADGGPAVDF